VGRTHARTPKYLRRCTCTRHSTFYTASTTLPPSSADICGIRDNERSLRSPAPHFCPARLTRPSRHSPPLSSQVFRAVPCSVRAPACACLCGCRGPRKASPPGKTPAPTVPSQGPPFRYFMSIMLRRPGRAKEFPRRGKGRIMFLDAGFSPARPFPVPGNSARVQRAFGPRLPAAGTNSAELSAGGSHLYIQLACPRARSRSAHQPKLQFNNHREKHCQPVLKSVHDADSYATPAGATVLTIIEHAHTHDVAVLDHRQTAVVLPLVCHLVIISL